MVNNQIIKQCIIIFLPKKQNKTNIISPLNVIISYNKSIISTQPPNPMNPLKKFHIHILFSFSFILLTAALRVSSSLQNVNLTRFFPSSGFR